MIDRIDTIERTDLRLHRVEDMAIAADTVAKLELYAHGTGWVAFVLRKNGTLHTRYSPRTQTTVDPNPEKIVWARDLTIALNRHVNYDGAWLVALIGDAKIFCFWKDPAGAIQAIGEEDDAWARVRAVPLDRWIENGEMLIRKHLMETWKDMGGRVSDLTKVVDTSRYSVPRLVT